MNNFYVNKKLKQLASRELIDDLKHYIKNTNNIGKTFDIEINLQGTKLDGTFVSVYGGTHFIGLFSSEMMNMELYLTLEK